MNCEVCGSPEVVGVACCGFGPISSAFCQECANKGLAPYNIMVAYISCAGEFPDDINEGYQNEVRRILKEINRTEEEFIKDVHKANEKMNQWMESSEGQDSVETDHSF